MATELQVWARAARPLARWTMANLVNRLDVWGGYWRGPNGEGGPVTRPAPGRRNAPLTLLTLERHYCTDRADGIVGLHAIAPDNTCRWIAVDIDAHGDTADTAQNERAAVEWCAKLLAWGVPALLTTSNGKGGFHLRGLFDEVVASIDAYDLVRWLVSDYERFGLTAPPETFPKQRKLSAPGQPGQYGNWLRLPGRHHKRDHWSQVRTGAGWLSGRAAIGHILACTGGPFPGHILAKARQANIAKAMPPLPRRMVIANDMAFRINAYIAKCPNLSEGQGRDDVAYQLAAWLVRDVGLSPEIALVHLETWDSRNTPPKGRERLEVILQNAARYGRYTIGGTAWN